MYSNHCFVDTSACYSFMRFPSVEEAQGMLIDAERLNPGPWVQHSIYVERAAEIIACNHRELAPLILGGVHKRIRRLVD